MTPLQFRVLVAAYAAGLALLLLINFGAGVPETVQEQWMRELASMPAAFKTILPSGQWLIFGAGFAALIGMFFFQPWARWLFLAWSAALVLVCFLATWWYESAWENAFTGVLSMMQGAIIALAFGGGAFERTKSAI